MKTHGDTEHHGLDESQRNGRDGGQYRCKKTAAKTAQSPNWLSNMQLAILVVLYFRTFTDDDRAAKS